MSGRAGRRGFDPMGNVVFFGVPYRKVQRLITANIPKLVGNFPINVSLVLRLLLLTSKGDDKKDALTKVCGKEYLLYVEHSNWQTQLAFLFLIFWDNLNILLVKVFVFDIFSSNQQNKHIVVGLRATAKLWQNNTARGTLPSECF